MKIQMNIKSFGYFICYSSYPGSYVYFAHLSHPAKREVVILSSSSVACSAPVKGAALVQVGRFMPAIHGGRLFHLLLVIHGRLAVGCPLLTEANEEVSLVVLFDASGGDCGGIDVVIVYHDRGAVA